MFAASKVEKINAAPNPRPATKKSLEPRTRRDTIAPMTIIKIAYPVRITRKIIGTDIQRRVGSVLVGGRLDKMLRSEGDPANIRTAAPHGKTLNTVKTATGEITRINGKPFVELKRVMLIHASAKIEGTEKERLDKIKSQTAPGDHQPRAHQQKNNRKQPIENAGTTGFSVDRGSYISILSEFSRQVVGAG